MTCLVGCKGSLVVYDEYSKREVSRIESIEYIALRVKQS